MSKLELIKDFWQKAELYSKWNPIGVGMEDVAYLCARVEKLEGALKKAIDKIGDGNNGPPQWYAEIFEEMESALSEDETKEDA